jgi:CBS domain containing-hemolysin-like protein
VKNTLVLTAVTMLLLLGFSALFSASETSISSISKTQYRRIRKSREKKDIRLAKLLSDPSRMVTTLLIGNNVVNIWSSSIATALAIGIFGEDGVGIATAIMTIAILVFAEITPKTIAANNPEGIARGLSPFISAVSTIFYPLVFVFSAVNSVFLSLMKKIAPTEQARVSEDELKTIIDMGKKEGALEKDEHDLLGRAFDFTDLTLRELMIPRTEMATIDISAPSTEVLDAFRKYRFSRMPVYEGSIESIRGIVHYKDVLFLLEKDEVFSLEALIRPALFVPENQGTYELLREMEKGGQNMAIVVDEHGSTAGLVTIDDAIAAVFGGIHDEYDSDFAAPAEQVRIISPSRIRIPGNLKLSDLNALLKTGLDSEYYETAGGFVMEQAGKLPAIGDQVRYNGIVFKIEDVSGRRIKTMLINLPQNIAAIVSAGRITGKTRT